MTVPSSTVQPILKVLYAMSILELSFSESGGVHDRLHI